MKIHSLIQFRNCALFKVLACASIALLSIPAVCAEGDWIPLFNGTNLEGWEQKNGLAHYDALDGMIVGTSVPNSPNSFLCTKKNYGDFELEFEVKLDKELNSGVQIRSESKADYQNGRVHGYQVEIAVDALRANQVECSLITVTNADHCFDYENGGLKDPAHAERFQRVVEFMKFHTKEKEIMGSR